MDKIVVKIGNLFESHAQTFVNTVNTVGVMGKGVALEFRKRFPDMFKDYVRRCESRQVRMGEPYLFKTLVPPWILNFPTKEHWRSVSNIADIERGLRYLKAHYKEWGIESLAVPPLGCGEGQLEWRVVGPTLYRGLRALDIQVELYAPFGTPHEELRPEFLAEGGIAPSSNGYRIAPAWIALVEVLSKIEREPFRWPLGRVGFQKLTYFGTVSGIPTGLQYRRASFGPFAADLKRHITALVNNGLIEEERVGNMFMVHPGRTFEDARRAYSADLSRFSDAIDRVTDLMLRMNTDQAELAATVHYAANELKHQEEAVSERDVLGAVLEWKKRRKPSLEMAEVASAIRHLNLLNWIEVEPDRSLLPDDGDMSNLHADRQLTLSLT